MDKKNGVHNVRELIERYNRELMAAYRQRPRSLTQEELDARYPPPNIEKDRAQLAVAAMAPPAPPVSDEPSETPDESTAPTPPTEAPAYVGSLQIYAFTGSTAEPIEGAQVFVSRDDGDGTLLYASVTTDRSGLTPVIPLPSVDPMLTQSPGAAQGTLPYVGYDIQVTATGFVPLRFENVPVYGGNSVTQPAAMVPLIAGDNPDLPLVYHSGGPENL